MGAHIERSALPSSHNDARRPFSTVARRCATIRVVRSALSRSTAASHRTSLPGVQGAGSLRSTAPPARRARCAGDGDTLLLPARQHHPCSPQVAIVSRGIARDKPVRGRLPRRRAGDFRVCGRRGGQKRMFSRAEAAKITGSAGTTGNDLPEEAARDNVRAGQHPCKGNSAPRRGH